MSDQRPTILHVDDDEANRYAVTRTLTKAGFTVIEAADGAGALREIARQPDLAILDIRLPDISGFEVCRRIKADAATANIPILHLSASFIRGEDKAFGLDGGADAYLVRPVEPVELIATVNALLRVRRSEALLRESEARLRVLADTIPQLAWYANADGHIVWYNRRWYDYTGTTPADMEGWGWQRVHDPAVLPAVLERWQASIATGQPFDMTFPLRGRDGTYRPFLTRVEPLADDAGRVVQWFGTNTDVAERQGLLDRERVARAAAESARAEAERSGRMKDEFLATLSHELRTPLSAILGWSQMLGRPGVKPEVLAEGIRTIERNARAQTQIIEDLLDMSRIISGKVSLTPQRIDLAAVLSAAIDTVRSTAVAKGVEIAFAPPPEVTAPTLGDATRLQQVFWNLLSNAIKFTPRGGGVNVAIQRQHSQWQVDVRDSGEGIREDFLPFVFDRFRQADASTTRRHGGLGLGLAIVKQLVELHGGKVRATSAGSGEGATFTVALPVNALLTPEVAAVQSPVVVLGDVAIADVRPTSHAPEIVAWDTSAGEDLRGVTILVVDDEPDARAMLRHLLGDRGARVLIAATADEALALVERERPDVLVSDIGMPGEDGYHLLQRIRALGPSRGGNVPAIALTAYARAEDRVKAVRAGFQMHVPKPVEPAELITMVASLHARGG